MPLPDRNVDWPPPAVKPATDLYTRYEAWYSGDPEKLAAAYGQFPGLMSGTADVPKGVPDTQRGGRFVGSLMRGAQRVFWGAPVSGGQVRNHKVHVPLASDIAMTSADLLFGEYPEITIPDTEKTSPAQKTLDELLDEANLAAVLLEAGEIASAFGGAYIRVRWDQQLSPDAPLFDVIPPDAAVPEWRSGRLAAVTFWRELHRPDGRHWTHLERHEPGAVLHGVYASTQQGRLGRRMALTDHEETAPFAQLVDANGDTIATGAKGLTAEYLPNMLPNRDLRGSCLGRSDYAGGVEGMLDALDEAWTSWLRDLRLGKGRLVVPRQYTASRGRGRGAVFDPEQEIFETIDALDNGDKGVQLTVVQFAIRVDEHDRTTRALVEQAVRGAGYSAQAFGEVDAVAATATEVNSRDSRSMRTRGKKALYAKGPVRRIVHTALQVWAAKLKPEGVGDVPVDRPPAVVFPDGVAPDPEALARTLQMLDAATAVSTYQKVKRLNPDWPEEDITSEVAKILKEKQPPAVIEPGGTDTGHGPDGPLRPGADDEQAGPGAGGATSPAGKPAGDGPPVKVAGKQV
jgi:A118 family predicted phage portal protein